MACLELDAYEDEERHPEAEVHQQAANALGSTFMAFELHIPRISCPGALAITAYQIASANSDRGPVTLLVRVDANGPDADVLLRTNMFYLETDDRPFAHPVGNAE
ncbi:hypothetical protein CHU98_g8170 [Xylaria longipes]|nr:hypothetical protein CHU98_g8170 [Xylaria longipes]